MKSEYFTSMNFEWQKFYLKKDNYFFVSIH